jgi:hypothetical protein
MSDGRLSVDVDDCDDAVDEMASSSGAGRIPTLMDSTKDIVGEYEMRMTKVAVKRSKFHRMSISSCRRVIRGVIAGVARRESGSFKLLACDGWDA